MLFPARSLLSRPFYLVYSFTLGFDFNDQAPEDVGQATGETWNFEDFEQGGKLSSFDYTEPIFYVFMLLISLLSLSQLLY